MSATEHRQRGSVLLPVVAAMVILLLASVAITELFATQRYRSVLTIDACRSYWIAEAGARHAATLGTELGTSVPFAGGSYTVTKSGDDYTATAVRGIATRLVKITATSTEGSGGEDPVDETASVATVSDDNKKKITLDLVSISSEDAVLESFSISANTANEDIKKLKLDNEEIWKENSGVELPTGTLTLNKGSTGDRTLDAGESPELKIEFDDDEDGTLTYTLVLNFTDGTSSTLIFTVSW
ncbi:MAG: hypothetical protein ACI8QZ_003728 [Chlamydiales bacterium]|jgi:hypothetical protein